MIHNTVFLNCLLISKQHKQSRLELPGVILTLILLWENCLCFKFHFNWYLIKCIGHYTPFAFQKSTLSVFCKGKYRNCIGGMKFKMCSFQVLCEYKIIKVTNVPITCIMLNLWLQDIDLSYVYFDITKTSPIDDGNNNSCYHFITHDLCLSSGILFSSLLLNASFAKR